MSMSRRNVDTESGVFFTAVGLLGFVFSLQYDFGTGAKMGPGFFPVVLSALLTTLGLLILASGLRQQTAAKPMPMDWRSLFLICAAVVFFGVALMRAGLLITVPMTIFIASFAQQRVNLRRTALIAIGLTAFTWLVFVAGLDLRIPLLPRV